MVKWNLLVEVASAVDAELISSDSSHGTLSRRWFEVYHEDDYVEMTLEITRWYDMSDDLLFVNVTILDLIIWDDDNNNIAIEDDYELLAELLELNRMVASFYIY